MKVLIADDEQKVCRLIEHLVDWEQLGMEIAGFASNGEEALAKIQQLQPDIVITDIRMPGLNGLEVIGRTKAQYPHIDFIVISGFKQFDYAKEALSFGVSNYLLKPVDQRELVNTLETVKERFFARKSRQKIQKNSRKRIFGHLDLSTGLASLNETFGFGFKEGEFTVAVIKIDGLAMDQLDSPYFRDKMEWLLEEHLKGCHDWEFSDENGQFCVLVNHENDISHPLGRVLDDLLQQQDVFRDFSVTIGLGKCLPSARWAVSQRLVRGVNRLIFADAQPPYFPLFKTSPWWPSFKAGLFDGLERRNLEAVRHSLDYLWTSVLGSGDESGYEVEAIVEGTRDFYRYSLEKLGHENVKAMGGLDHCASAQELFDALSGQILSTFSHVLETEKNRESRPVLLAKKFIDENYSQALTLERVSGEVGFSSAYFSTLFKKGCGESFTDYLFKRRMEEAKRKLRDGDDIVASICAQVGYADIKHFNKGFKKYTGLTPKAYRKMYS